MLFRSVTVLVPTITFSDSVQLLISILPVDLSAVFTAVSSYWRAAIADDYGDQSWVFFGGSDAKAETPVLWPPHAKS